jgi:nicotinamidase-related amidase
MPGPSAALIVIDMLADFFTRQPTLAAQRLQLAASINRLSSNLRQRGHPVIWVRQEFKADLSDAFLDMRRRDFAITIEGTPGAQILPELDRHAEDIVIVKKRYSAFFGTNLDDTLARLLPQTPVLAGINTHACIRTAAIDAYQRDFDVIVASDCVASYDDSWHKETLRYLDGRIARLMASDEVMALWSR